MHFMLRRACLLTAVALCALALGQALPRRGHGLSLGALAGSLRDLEPGAVISALQSLRLRSIRGAWREFWDIFGPGGRLHPGWFIEHQGHLFIEGGLMAIILVLFFQTGYRPTKGDEEPLTERVRAAAAGRRRRALLLLLLPPPLLLRCARGRRPPRPHLPTPIPPPPGRHRPPPARKLTSSAASGSRSRWCRRSTRPTRCPTRR
jgi:hypothetical protein